MCCGPKRSTPPAALWLAWAALRAQRAVWRPLLLPVTLSCVLCGCVHLGPVSTVYKVWPSLRVPLSFSAGTRLVVAALVVFSCIITFWFTCTLQHSHIMFTHTHTHPTPLIHTPLVFDFVTAVIWLLIAATVSIIRSYWNVPMQSPQPWFKAQEWRADIDSITSPKWSRQRRG